MLRQMRREGRGGGVHGCLILSPSKDERPDRVIPSWSKDDPANRLILSPSKDAIAGGDA